MEKQILELPKAGSIYNNKRSLWSSPPLVEPPPQFNPLLMTVDLLQENEQTERMVWPMPMMDVTLEHLKGATVFFRSPF